MQGNKSQGKTKTCKQIKDPSEILQTEAKSLNRERPKAFLET